jgi:hypothetical protein
VPLTLRFCGPLRVSRLIVAVASVAAYHDVLFTVFDERDGEPCQRLLDVRELDCPFFDLADVAAAQRRSYAEKQISTDARRPFDLRKGPMLRANLYRIAPDEHLLQLTFHQIACDEWSLDVFQRQLLDAYRQGERGSEPSPVQYADYALWQRDMLSGLSAEIEIDAWKDALRAAPAILDLGADYSRPAGLSYRGETGCFQFSDVPVNELTALGADEGASLYLVLLAAFLVLAARHSGSDDLVLGSPIAGRGPTELDGLVGLFADSLVLRVDLAGDPSFRELISRARESILDARSRGQIPFDLLASTFRDLGLLVWSAGWRVRFRSRAAVLPG